MVLYTKKPFVATKNPTDWLHWMQLEKTTSFSRKTVGSQDAAFIVTAGNDKQIRIWKRTQAGFFASMSDGCPIGSNGSMVSFNGLFHLF